MRILFLTNSLQGNNGWSRYSLDSIEAIKDLGHQVLVLTSEESNQKEILEYPILDKPLSYLANPLKSFLASLRIKGKIKEFEPDIIHFMVEPYANILPFLKVYKAKTFLTVHGTYSVMPILLKSFFKKKLAWQLSNNYYKKLDKIIAISNYTKNHLLIYCPELKVKIEVITNGISLKKNKIIDSNKKPNNKRKKILFIGLIKERKGLLQAIEACKYYYDNFSNNFTFKIVGHCNDKDIYYQKLQNKINEYNLFENILFLGSIPNDKLEKYYLESDLFLMPSINIDNNFEGFGLVFLEANTKGVACIGSKDCGTQDAIIDGKTGYLINVLDFKEISSKMNLILNQDSINITDCINWAKKNDITIKVKELLKLYSL